MSNLEKSRWAERVSLAIYAIMILSLCATQLSREGGPLYTIWVIQVVPLLIFLPGILARHYRTYSWLCFVLLIYFVRGVDGVASLQPHWVDYIVLFGSFSLFISAMLTSRWMQNSLKEQQAQ